MDLFWGRYHVDGLFSIGISPSAPTSPHLDWTSFLSRAVSRPFTRMVMEHPGQHEPHLMTPLGFPSKMWGTSTLGDTCGLFKKTLGPKKNGGEVEKMGFLSN